MSIKKEIIVILTVFNHNYSIPSQAIPNNYLE